MPAALKYVATGLDVVLLTLLLMVADGPRSPLVIGFFLIPAMATLRFQLRLVWFATIAAMLGYLWLLGWARWIEDVRDVRVPRYQELIFLTALALSGLIQGQVIRRVKSMAAEYARRLAAAGRCTGPVPSGPEEGCREQGGPEPNPDLTCWDCGATNDPAPRNAGSASAGTGAGPRRSRGLASPRRRGCRRCGP